MTEQQEIVGYRMSQQQHACWLSALRSVAAVFIVDGVDDSLDLRKSLEKVVARHEILRTTFCRPFGRRHAIQVIHDHQPILWLEESSRATRKSDRAIPSFDDLDIDLKGLDPQEGPTLKVRVLELGAGHFEIALTARCMCRSRQPMAGGSRVGNGIDEPGSRNTTSSIRRLCRLATGGG